MNFERGFTLIETVVAMAIFVLMAGAIFGIYDFNQKAYKQGQDSAEITQNGRVILERISRDVRQAKKIAAQLPLEKGEGATEIVFEDGRGSQPYRYVRYYKEESNIKKEVYTFCFSQDGRTCLGEYVAYNATPQEGQSLLKVQIEEPGIIGEFAENISFWGGPLVGISILLEKGGQTAEMETKILGRNL